MLKRQMNRHTKVSEHIAVAAIKQLYILKRSKRWYSPLVKDKKVTFKPFADNKHT